MAALEDAVEPSILRLARGEGSVLTGMEVLALERWAAKTCLVLESSLPHMEMKVLTPELAKAVMRACISSTGPQGFYTWLCATQMESPSYMRTSVSAFWPPGHDCAGHGWRVTTIQLGSVAFLTVYTGDRLAGEYLWGKQDDLWDALGSMPHNGPKAIWHIDRDSPLSFDQLRLRHDNVRALLVEDSN